MKDTDWCGSNTDKTMIGVLVGGVDQGLCGGDRGFDGNVDQGLCLVIKALVGSVDQGMCVTHDPQCSSKYSIWKLNLLPLPVQD